MGGSSIFARIASFSAFNFVTNSLPFMHASAGRHRIAPDGNRLDWERNSAGSQNAALRGIGVGATRAPTELRRGARGYSERQRPRYWWVGWVTVLGPAAILKSADSGSAA